MKSEIMGRLKRTIANRIRSILGRYTVTGCLENLIIASNVKIEPGAVIELGHEKGKGVVYIGSKTLIRRFALISCHGGDIHIGSNCSVQCFSAVYGLGGLRIGDWTRIAAHTLIIPGNHQFTDPSIEIKKQGLSKKGIKVGRDVWIASNCLILDGVNIGDGAVIGGGSVVTKNIPPSAVAVGNPARVIKYRGAEDSSLPVSKNNTLGN
jgi:acetyltransferase-like isoleucine patch superfamily enzyme